MATEYTILLLKSFISIPVALSVILTGVAVSPSNFASGHLERIALMIRLYEGASV